MSEPKDNAAIVFLTVDEIAAQLKVSKMTVYRLINEGALPAYKVGRSFRVAETDFREFISNAKI